MQFLSLAPTTSASYPSAPLTKSPVQSPIQTAKPDRSPIKDAIKPAEASPELLPSRRSSSFSSDASVKQRFLKLGPVHFGVGDGMGDWSDILE